MKKFTQTLDTVNIFSYNITMLYVEVGKTKPKHIDKRADLLKMFCSDFILAQKSSLVNKQLGYANSVK